MEKKKDLVFWVEDLNDASVEFEDSLTNEFDAAYLALLDTQRAIPGRSFCIKAVSLEDWESSTGKTFQEFCKVEPENEEEEKMDEHTKVINMAIESQREVIKAVETDSLTDGDIVELYDTYKAEILQVLKNKLQDMLVLKAKGTEGLAE